MKATKTKKGLWTVQVYLGTTPDGKKIQRRITGPDRKAVEAEAAALRNERRDPTISQSFEACTNAYFEARSASLSPSTLKGYKSMLKRLKAAEARFCALTVHAVTTREVQRVTDDMVREGLSPKYVANAYGFICSVLTWCGIKIAPPHLPQKERPEIHIPDEVTVRRTLKAAKGTALELPIMLAAFGPLRRGEICALRPEDVRGDVVHVHRDIVRTEDNQWVEKPPKTYSSDRYIRMPQFVANKLAAAPVAESGRYIAQTPDALSTDFARLLKANGIDHYRFHDLRHFCISDLHAKGVPDIYIQQRSGHATAAVLRQVYTHTMQDQSEEQTKFILAHFESMVQ